MEKCVHKNTCYAYKNLEVVICSSLSNGNLYIYKIQTINELKTGFLPSKHYRI